MKEAFKTIVAEGTLGNAAKWLNEQHYRIKPAREGGGLRTRLGYYTVKNFGCILRSKFYIGGKSTAN